MFSWQQHPPHTLWMFGHPPPPFLASQVAQVVKNPPANAGDARDLDSIPVLGRFPGGGNGNLLQYSCLRNPTDRGAWRATVHGPARSRTGLTHTHTQPRCLLWTCQHLSWRACLGSLLKKGTKPLEAWHHPQSLCRRLSRAAGWLRPQRQVLTVGAEDLEKTTHRWIRRPVSVTLLGLLRRDPLCLSLSGAHADHLMRVFRSPMPGNEASFLQQRLQAEAEGSPACLSCTNAENDRGCLGGGVLSGSSVWLLWTALPENQSEQTLIHFPRDTIQPHVPLPHTLCCSKRNGFLPSSWKKWKAAQWSLHPAPAYLVDSSSEHSEYSSKNCC